MEHTKVILLNITVANVRRMVMSSSSIEDKYPHYCVRDEDCLGDTVCAYHNEWSTDRLTCWCSSSVYKLTSEDTCTLGNSLVVLIAIVLLLFKVTIVLSIIMCRRSCRRNRQATDEPSTESMMQATARTEF